MRLKISFLIFWLLSLVTVILYLSVNYKSLCSDLCDNDTISENDVSKWYLIAESPQHKLFDSGVRGGNIVTVLDKDHDALLIPDESCEMSISEELLSDKSNSFYNKSVGIKNIGPYKTINYDEKKGLFTQTVLNMGCVSSEGSIRIFTEEDLKTASCEITIKYEFLGC